MKAHFKLIILGVVTLFIFLLSTIPATFIVKHINSPALRLTGVSGTIWRGQADQLITPEIQLDTIQWNINPLWLITGAVKAKLQLGNADSTALKGDVHLKASIFKKLSIYDTQLLADADWLVTQLALPVAIGGQLQLNIEDAILKPTQLPEIAALVQWQDAIITYPDTLALGAYRLEINHQPEDEPTEVIGLLNDVNGALTVNGKLNIDAGGDYQFNATVKPQPSLGSSIQQAVQLLGRQRPDGSVAIQQRGNIRQFL